MVKNHLFIQDINLARILINIDKFNKAKNIYKKVLEIRMN